jgi:DNA-binding SARP family transcriptional activator
MQFQVFGGIGITDGERRVEAGPPKQRAVLALLLLEANRVVPADRLVDLLWDGDTSTGLGALQSYVSRLRNVLEPDRRPRDPATVLVTQQPGYRLAIDRADLDLLRYEDLIRSGRERLRSGDPTTCLAELDQADRLRVGPLLPELADEPFVIDAAAHLASLSAQSAEAAAEARLAQGDHTGALVPLERAVDEHPLDERLHGLLALALYRAGRQADGLRTIERARRSLADTAGLDLGPELRRLEGQMLAHDDALAWRPPTGPTPAPAAAPGSSTAASHPDETSGRTADEPGDAVAPPRSSAMVGRIAEIDTLLAALHEARAGRGSAATLVGEPGIGKTRLAQEVATRAAELGVVTAWVRCPESGAPPYWPISQMGEQLVDAGVTDQLMAPPPAAQGEPTPADDAARFELQRAVMTVLATSDRPMLFVVDDLQWADAESLRLIGHGASDLGTTSALLLVTTRPLDDTSPRPLVDCLGDLTRPAGSTHLALSGLTAPDVAEWLQMRSDAVSAEVAELVHDRTGGHPLFVKELTDLLASEGRLDDPGSVRDARTIPQGVQFVVRRRVARLAPTTQRLLATASVVGRTFDLEIVSAVMGVSADDVLDALEPALDAGLVIEDDRPTRFRFSHALVADALAAEMNAARRARVHAAAATAMAERAGDDLEADVELIAHHALLGVPAGTLGLALDSSIQAARQAEGQLAFEVAADHWARVVETLEQSRPADRIARIDALTSLAASSYRAELVDPAKQAVLAAIDLADKAGDPERMGRAAVLLNAPNTWPPQGYGVVESEVVEALERTIAALPPDDHDTRARVLSALAFASSYSPDPDMIDRVTAEAIAEARAGDDPLTLARVLVNWCHSLERPGQFATRQAVIGEIFDVIDAHGAPADLELVAWFRDARTRYQATDIDGARASLARCWDLVGRTGRDAYRAQLGWLQATFDATDGRHEEARRLAVESGEVYRRTRSYDAQLILFALTVAMAVDVGGIEDLAAHVPFELIESSPYARLWGEYHTWILFEIGACDEAAAKARTLTNGPLVRDWSTTFVACMAVFNRAEIGDVETLSGLVDLIRTDAGQWAAAGTTPIVAGMVDLALARGTAALGATAEARRWFDSAVAGHERMRANAWLARTLVQQGRFLRGTGDEADAAQAEQVLARARQLASDRGFVYLLRQLDQLDLS